MSTAHEDRLIHWLLGSLKLETTLFHLGQYCGSWKASTTGLARSGFHLILNGDCWLHLPDEQSAIPLHSGDSVIFFRDLVHYLSPHADPLVASVAPRREMGPIDCEVQESVALACGFFDFKSGLDDVFLGPLPDYVVVTKRSGQLQELRPLFDLILAEARSSGEEASPLITRLVDLLFFYVIRHVCRRNEVSAGLWAILARPEFAALLQAVIADPAKDWTVESMADVAHMSRATFHKRFAQACGNSPSNFLLQVRMRLASRLIERGTSLSRVAEKVGYQSDAAFSRAFKKATGTLPGAYKRSQQKADLLAA